MATSKSSFNLYMTPKNTNGEPITLDDEALKTLPPFLKVADTRTRNIALSTAEGHITLREALQSAYIQGMHDAKISLENAIDDEQPVA